MNEPGTRRPSEEHAVLRLLLGTHLPFLVLVWTGFAVLVAGITLVVSPFRDVEFSGWDIACSVLRWVALAYGWWWVDRFLPVCLIHGRTRREFMVDVTVFTAVACTTSAALTTLWYTGEKVLYDLMDWTQGLQKDRLYDSFSDRSSIFLTYWIVLLVWSTMGMLLKAGSGHPNEGVRVLTVLPAVGMGLLAAAGTGADNLFAFRVLVHPATGGFSPELVALLMAAYAAGVALTWVLVRSFPVRPTRNG